MSIRWLRNYVNGFLAITLCLVTMTSFGVIIEDEEGNVATYPNKVRRNLRQSYTLSEIDNNFITPSGENGCQDTTLFGSCKLYEVRNGAGAIAAYIGRNDNGVIGGAFKDCMTPQAFLDKVAMPQLDQMEGVDANQTRWVTCPVIHQANLINSGRPSSIRATITIPELVAAHLGQTCLGLSTLYSNLAIACDQTSSGQASLTGLYFALPFIVIAVVGGSWLCLNGNEKEGAAVCECCCRCAIGSCAAVAANQ